MTQLLSDNPLKAIHAIRKGLRPEAIAPLAERMGLTVAELAQAIGLNTRTLNRVKSKGGRLSLSYSERLSRLDRVLARAEDLFAKRQDARDWLKSPCPALGGASPISMLDTDLGTAEVERVLLAVDWGVYL